MVLSCKNVSKAFVTDVVLDNISFHLEDNDKMAIVGVNGAGKTTLLRILTGEMALDSGEVYIRSGAKMGYMSQLFEMNPENTVEEELTSVFTELIALEKELVELTAKMPSLKGQDLEDIMSIYDKKNFTFEQMDGYKYKSKIRGIINGLAFDRFGNLKIEKLSGGQKTQVALGKLLLSEPDLLLLDEPTNHLDIESVKWLEDFLRAYEKALIVVSHDRYFLNRIVGKVFEIENTHGFLYKGNYSFYAKEKELVRQSQLKRYVDQQKIIKKQEESIKLLRSFNREKSIKRAESKQKLLNKLERVERPEDLPDTIRIDLSPKIQSGNDVLTVQELSKNFGNKLIFENASFEIKKGEKVALIGPNGVGKTTLFRILMEEISQNTGSVKKGRNVIAGYYDQGQLSLDENKTIIEEISDAYPKLTLGEIRNVLAAFVFTGDDVFKKISALSGGEKGRVSLTKIMLSGANFLLLDEPTNHLDMFSKEILEDALKGYDGTLFFISHDRYFINTCADRVIELNKHFTTSYLGNYDYYLEKKAEILASESAPQSVTEAKKDWIEKKEADARERKLKNLIKTLTRKIEETEVHIDKLNKELEKDSVNTDYEKSAKLYKEIEENEEILLELYEKLDTANNS